jgi:hypothetical protein
MYSETIRARSHQSRDKTKLSFRLIGLQPVGRLRLAGQGPPLPGPPAALPFLSN